MEDHAKYARRFKKKLPPETVGTVVTKTGFNASYNKKIVSFHYKNKSLGEGTAVFRSRVIKFPINGEVDVWSTLVGYKEPDKVTEKPLSVPIADNQGSGVQQCIDHIGKKLQLIEADTTRNNNQLVTLLRQLQQELKQYL